MRIWRSEDPKPTNQTDGLWVYNALDTIVTHEVLLALLPQLNEVTGATYQFSLDLQAPLLEMMLRGIRVDKAKRNEVSAILESKLAYLNSSLQEILEEGLGIYGLNPASPNQLKDLFYTTLGIPPIRQQGTITTNRKALERIVGYFQAETIARHILAIRDCAKQLSVLRTGIDADGRIRTSYKIAGTETGRLASSGSAFWTGTNLQNITGELRYIFVADPGYKLAYIDLEQAESRAVGAIIWNVFGDGRYLDACESGDLHTTVCRMCWPDLGWSGVLAEDKRLAKQPFYRHFDYRDIAKRLGHATNYFGKPPHIAKETHIPQALVQAFQDKYIPEFGLSQWHNWVRQKLVRDGWITTFMGRFRWFFGRRWDQETLRSAIAYEPQSAVADILNRGLQRVYHASRDGLQVQLLLQVHDAIVFQYPEELENEIVPAVMKLLEEPVPLLNGRTLRIPTEAFVGWNWAYARNSKKEVINPDGLEPFTGNDTRKRSAPASLLDRRVSSPDRWYTISAPVS